MNRMIKLFQQRSDQVYEQYIRLRDEAIKSTPNSLEWNEKVWEGKVLRARAEVWSKAAELLRKEELNR